MHISQEAVLELLLKMLSYDTTNPPGNEKPLAEMLGKLLADKGFETELIDHGNNRASLTARLRGNGERKALMFNGHLDVVPTGQKPWTYPPFEPRVVDGKVYGRGASDMKSGLAAMIVAAMAVHESGRPLKGDFILTCSADEEIGNIGARSFAATGELDTVGAIIIGEPSSCTMNIAEKGALWLSIATLGKTAHGAFPQQGVNAIMGMNAVITELANYRFSYTENALLTPPTLNISTIQGGVGINVVPDRCALTVDIRSVPGMDHAAILKDIEGICKRAEHAVPGLETEITVLTNHPAVDTAPDHPFIRMGQEVSKELSGKEADVFGVNFYTDAVVFLPGRNIPAILYGPGDAAMAHQPDEYVPADRLEEAARFYAAMIERYLIA